jgi:UDP-GlcNAc:undecaprenyl-phosphate/decaprenyl-phosphate GlcNAc-1-phosphate transferase
MTNLYYLAFVILLLVVSLVYYKVARVFQIVDLPNHRTMHQGATIRGGGVIVLFGMVISSIFLQYPGIYFIAGLIIIGITGFVDDLVDLPGKVRFPFQIVAMLLMFMEMDFFQYHWVVLLIVLIVATGVLNAFNFMDGINGLTAGYSLVLVFSMIYLNEQVQHVIERGWLYCYLLAIAVFGFFNFRKKAVCFAGDVGSLTIAFINVYLLLKFILETGHFILVFFLTLYGIDTIFTIIQRLANRENIFEAHNKHFFQVAVRKLGFSHIQMSGIYMMVQVAINTIIILMLTYSQVNQWLIMFVMLAVLSGTYILMKFKIQNSAG